jgi:hypothetical protein
MAHQQRHRERFAQRLRRFLPGSARSALKSQDSTRALQDISRELRSIDSTLKRRER